ncbi:MAG: PKD domain-containing protein [Ferruginibacter sp.]
MKKTLIIISLITFCHSLFAQDFSNKGTDFWLGYGYHVRYLTGNPINGQEMVLYFATDVATNVKVEIPGVGYVRNYNIPANTIFTSEALPKNGTQDSRLSNEGVYNTGIHITSDKPVVAYAHIYNGNVSGATLLFPTNTLGKEYFSMNYTQRSNEANSNSFFFVVAADTGTTSVEITPSQSTLTHPAGVPFTVSLTQGQIYNVMGTLNGNNGNDLTGSKIRSVSTNGVGCKKIAVFSGSGKIYINCGGTQASSADNIFAQAFPKSAWGKKFLTAPTKNMPFNYFRVGVSVPTAVVKLNGVVQTGLAGGFYYDLPLTNQPTLIEADEPIMVSQYITTAGSNGVNGTCGNRHPSNSGWGDPEMIYISPIEQTIDRVILNSTPNAAINDHFINIIVKNSAVNSVLIDGVGAAASFLPHPQEALYSYAQVNVAAGQHIVEADSGFNAIAYGYGGAESYGYNAGTNLKDLYNFISPLNPLNISGQNTACACTPFFYSITYPFQPISLLWDFKGFQTPNVTVNNPVHDSTYFINGKQVWRYKLPTPYTYCPAGNYPVSITAGTTGTDGCGNFQVKEDTLFVKNIPTTDFYWINNGCVTNPVIFRDTTTLDPGVYSYKWNWDFGDGTTSTEHFPVHQYTTPGTYTVRFSITTNVGCVSNFTPKTITVTNVPVAKFGISNPVCAGLPVTFSDSSIAFAPGALTKWMWNYGDGTVDTLASGINRIKTFSPWGNKTFTLKVATISGCESPLFSKTFMNHPIPVAGFNLPIAVCLPYNSAAFTNNSTIADGTQAGFNYVWDFGDPTSGALNTSTGINPTHLYNTTGPYTIKLQVTSAAGCVDDSTRILSAIYPKPVASFNVQAENCLNAVTSFSSTSSGAGTGATISNWFWDFGDGTPVVSGQNVNHTYAIADTFTIKHWVITDKGCLSDTTTRSVIVNPHPNANFSNATPLCATRTIAFSDASNTAAGNINAWKWEMGDGTIYNLNSPATFNHTYLTVGNFTVKLTVTTDKGCSNPIPFTKSIVVSPLPIPGFISPEVCLSDASAIFTDTSSVPTGSITSWAWNFGDPASGALNTSTLQNPQHRYNAIGNYTATLTVTTNNGCVATLPQSFTVNGDIPVSNFNVVNTTNFCGYDSIKIQDAATVNFGSVTKVEIYWDNAGFPAVVETDDLPTPGKIYKHLYPILQIPVTYTIRYRAFSGATCVNDRFKTVTVHAVPKVQFNVIPDICLDAVPYQITQATEIGGVPGLGAFTGTGVSTSGLFSPSIAGAGTFPIKYTFTSTNGCIDTLTKSIKVLAPGTANFTIGNPKCEKNAISFTDASSAAAGTLSTWTWNFGDATPTVVKNSAATFTHVFATYGSYNVTLTTTTSNGCNLTTAQTVLVNPLPVPDFTFPVNTCLPNANVLFTNTSSIADGTENGFTYAWNFGDINNGATNTSVSKNPTHLYSAVGPYNVNLRVTSAAGCIKDSTKVLNSIRPQPTADFSSDSLSLCVNQSVRFTDRSNPANGTLTQWQWNFGNGSALSTVQAPAQVTYTTDGTFTVELQIENNFGCRDTVSKPFIVYPYPVLSAGTDKVVLEGGEIVLTATATGNNLSYLWTPNQYLSANTVLNPVVRNPLTDMTYVLTVTAQGGCFASDAVFVKLLKAPVIPNTFTPNNDGINDYWVIQYLDSYPQNRVQVFDRSGQVIYESKGYTAPWDGTYKGKSIPFGTYYYIIEPGSGRKPFTGYVTLIK